MYLTRWMIVLILILAMLVAATPQARVVIDQSWQQARPRVIEAMDSLYAGFRNFVAGSDPHKGIDDNAPGVDYDHVITMEHGIFH